MTPVCFKVTIMPREGRKEDRSDSNVVHLTVKPWRPSKMWYRRVMIFIGVVKISQLTSSLILCFPVTRVSSTKMGTSAFPGAGKQIQVYSRLGSLHSFILCIMLT